MGDVEEHYELDNVQGNWSSTEGFCFQQEYVVNSCRVYRFAPSASDTRSAKYTLLDTSFTASNRLDESNQLGHTGIKARSLKTKRILC